MTNINKPAGQDFSPGSYTSNGGTNSNNGLSPNIPGSSSSHPTPGVGEQAAQPSANALPTANEVNGGSVGQAYYGDNNANSPAQQSWNQYQGMPELDAVALHPASAPEVSEEPAHNLDEAKVRQKVSEILADGIVTLAEIRRLRAMQPPAGTEEAKRFNTIANETLMNAARTGHVSSHTLHSLQSNYADIFGGNASAPAVNQQALRVENAGLAAGAAHRWGLDDRGGNNNV